MNLKPHLWVLLPVLAITPALAEEQQVEADWLYLTAQGSWIERSAELSAAATALPLPMTELSASAFWWQADDPGVQLSWRSADAQWLQPDTVVQVDGWSGSWTVERVGADLLALSQANMRRLLPGDQWHRLSWVSAAPAEDFQLTVQAGADTTPVPFRYAWFDNALGAEVRYSLELEAARPVLRQQLVLHNNSDYAIRAPGYSYAQSRSQGRMMLARSEAMAADSAVSVAAPTAGDSSGQATLQSDQPLMLASGSHSWLGVQQIELSAIRHQYRFDWNTRQSATVPGQWALTLVADDELPAIAGPLQVAVWDQQVALLETRYQPQQATRAELQLGASDMMTLATERLGSSEWELVLTNRNSRSAEASLDLSHWDNDRNAQAGISLPVPAQGTLRLQVRLDNGQLSVRPL